MKEAIQKAIEGGYKIPFKNFKYGEHMVYEPVFEGNDLSYREISTDPLFWQALGKAEGWGVTSRKILKICPECKGYGYTVTENDQSMDCYECGNSGKVHDTKLENIGNTWLNHWHRFIDHLAEGKDADGFFNEILK